MDNIKEFLKTVPEKPGIYIMYSKAGEVLYVGKAKDLSKRLPSYFREKLNRNQKIEKMVTLIDRIEFTITNNEVEALILENNLIKEKKPRYNTLLRDDKSYPFIEITLKDDYPRLILSRSSFNKTSKYFGPYPNIDAAKEVIDLLKNLYKIRSCETEILPKKDCLYYQLGKCNAPCIEKESIEEYKNHIKEAISFLNGNTGEVKKEYKNKMEEASLNLEFEKAMKYRDILSAIDKISNKQIITEGTDDKDVLTIRLDDKDSFVLIFIIRNGKIIDKKTIYFSNKENEDKRLLLSDFIENYYLNNISIPNLIVVEEDLEDKDLLKDYLKNIKGHKVEIIKPQKGDNKKLLDLAIKNADLIVNENNRKKQTKELLITKGIRELEELLNLKNLNRLESYDISHLSGTFTVGSMIVYEDNKFNKKAYRKFKLEDKNDDFNSLKKMLERRFKDENLKEIIPSALLIDGGKEQVSKIEELLEELKISIPVIGMVKDDTHSTDHLYFKENSFNLKEKTNAFKLVTNIQDETHNFAINYNRKLRNKNFIKSELDNIEGIGEVKRKLLLNTFGSIDNIKKASITEIEEIKGISKTDAEKIYNYFNKKEEV